MYLHQTKTKRIFRQIYTYFYQQKQIFPNFAIFEIVFA